jgi:uncharacterized membrane protein HdeD (DUF308 family)
VVILENVKANKPNRKRIFLFFIIFGIILLVLGGLGLITPYIYASSGVLIIGMMVLLTPVLMLNSSDQKTFEAPDKKYRWFPGRMGENYPRTSLTSNSWFYYLIMLIIGGGLVIFELARLP